MASRAPKRIRRESTASTNPETIPQAAQSPPSPSSELVCTVGTSPTVQFGVSSVPSPREPSVDSPEASDPGPVTVTVPVNLDQASHMPITSLPDEFLTFFDPTGLGTDHDWTFETEPLPSPISMRDLIRQYRAAVQTPTTVPPPSMQQDLLVLMRIMTLLTPHQLKPVKQAWDRMFPMMLHQAILSLIPLLSPPTTEGTAASSGSSPGTTTLPITRRFASAPLTMSDPAARGLGCTSHLVRRLLPTLAHHISKVFCDFLMLFDLEQFDPSSQPPTDE